MKPRRRGIMEADTVPQPVAKVTGLYRSTVAQMGRTRDFSPENGGYTSPVFEIRIADETYG